MRGGMRILILAACVPLIIPPGVCLCAGNERVAQSPGLCADNGSPPVPGHRHKHGGHLHSGCCCIGELGLDEDDCVQPAETFTLVFEIPPTFLPVPPDVPRFVPLVRVVPKAGFPPHLAQLALLI